MGKYYVRKTDRPYNRITPEQWETILQYCHESLGRVAMRVGRNPNGLQKPLRKARAIANVTPHVARA